MDNMRINHLTTATLGDSFKITGQSLVVDLSILLLDIAKTENLETNYEITLIPSKTK